jgi:predicted nucleic acid-binding protein
MPDLGRDEDIAIERDLPRGGCSDTNIVSELRKGDRANVGVRDWSAGVDDADVYTSVLDLGEICHGIESIRRRDASAALALEQWLVPHRHGFGDRVLPIDARVRGPMGGAQRPGSDPDRRWAPGATALVHDLTLVTRNVRDVADTGALTLDPAR